MTYDFKVVVPPVIRSFCPMHNQKDMIDNINKTGNVFFDVSTQTKTSLFVSVYNGETRFVCGYIPEGCENLKFHEQSRYNMWDDRQYVSNYFKMLKSQKWPEFKHYLTKLLESMHLNIDGTLKVNVELPPNIREKLEAPAYS